MVRRLRDKRRKYRWKNVGVACPECGVEIRVGLEIREGVPLVMGWARKCDHVPTRGQVQRLVDGALEREEINLE